MTINVSIEYSQVLKGYMSEYNMEAIDIAFLIKTKKEVIEGLLDSKKGIVLNTLEAIAQIFGLRYFQFGDPNFPMPDYHSLPQKTKDRITYRKKEGSSLSRSYNSLGLTEKILIVLSKYGAEDQFLPSEIGKKVNIEFNLNLVDFNKITDRFKKGLKGIVEKTGNTHKIEDKKGPSEEYYRLIKIPTETLKKAKEKISKAK